MGRTGWRDRLGRILKTLLLLVTGGASDAGDGGHLIVVMDEVLKELPGLALPLIEIFP